MVQYRPLNLLADFAHLGRFDVVFCRNVLIYFDQETKIGVLNRIAQACSSRDGYLVLGAAETVVGPDRCVQADARQARPLCAEQGCDAGRRRLRRRCRCARSRSSERAELHFMLFSAGWARSSAASRSSPRAIAAAAPSFRRA